MDEQLKDLLQQLQRASDSLTVNAMHKRLRAIGGYEPTLDQWHEFDNLGRDVELKLSDVRRKLVALGLMEGNHS